MIDYFSLQFMSRRPAVPSIYHRPVQEQNVLAATAGDSYCLHLRKFDECIAPALKNDAAWS